MKRAAELLVEAKRVVANGERYANGKIAWNRYEAMAWFEAHIERGLMLCDVPREYRDAVFELIKIRQSQIPNESDHARAVDV